MAFDRQELITLVERHQKVARIAIVETAGSTPREMGTVMYVWSNGQKGTIGGGALEHQAVLAARQQLGENRDVLASYPLGPRLGQCCGGHVKLWTEVYNLARCAQINPMVMCRALAPLKKPSVMLGKWLSEMRQGHNIPQTTRVQDGWIIEPCQRQRQPVWIWGAGHVGRALITVLSPLPELEITWIDTHKDRFPADRPTDLHVLYGQNTAHLMAHAPRQAHHLILTYSHQLDFDLCHHGLRHGFKTLGLLGSATKWARFRKRLQQLGHQVTEIDRITCPIGDPRFGKHPQQIAIGVAATFMELDMCRAETWRKHG